MRYLIFLFFLAGHLASYSQLTTSYSVTNASCSGGCDGSFAMTVYGGTPPYLINWLNPLVSGFGSSGLCPGIYFCTIMDGVGLTASDSVTISGSFNTNITTGNDTCGLCVGSASAVPTGGISPYTYSWFPTGGILPTETGLCSGYHSVTVVDSIWCTSTIGATVNNVHGSLCQLGSINGTIFMDSNLNCTLDPVENGLANYLVQAIPGPYYGMTDSNGTYSIIVLYGIYNITQVLQPYCNEVCPTSGISAIVDSVNLSSRLVKQCNLR